MAKGGLLEAILSALRALFARPAPPPAPVVPEPAPAPKQATTPPKTPAVIAAAVLIAAPLTASFEGLRTKPYKDPGDGRATVCYGETEREMRQYTPEECKVLLQARLAADYAPAVLKCVPAISERPQILAASTDAAYNAGTAAFCRSPMARRFNASDWAGGCQSFVGWYVRGGGKVLPGLVRRRQAEAALCRRGLA